ncbi:MAG TPA: VRR-NUC domain-containing protein [Sphingomicrobium sp.]|nr:VRR-NUC domain-containing protein [Sphingomicrobium sp.]
MREREHEKLLRKTVVRAGGLCIKLPAYLYRGIPDRMVLMPGGRIYFLELKAEGKKPSVTQSAFRKILQAMGFYSEIIQGKDEMERFLDDRIRPHL